MLDLVRIFFVGFGAITIAGGLVGFVKAKSRASLVAGGLSGTFLLVAAYLVGPAPRAALILGLVVSLALLGRFASKVRMTQKAIVPGVMTAFGIIGVLLTITGLIR